MSGATQLKIQAGTVTLQGSSTVSEASLAQVSWEEIPQQRSTHSQAPLPPVSFPGPTPSCLIPRLTTSHIFVAP